MVTKPKISEIVDRLTKLAKLHSDGAITDDEFQALRAKIISAVSDSERHVPELRVQQNSNSQKKIVPSWGSTVERGIGSAALAFFWYSFPAVSLVEAIFFIFR
jgi:hypothetical protein